MMFKARVLESFFVKFNAEIIDALDDDLIEKMIRENKTIPDILFKEIRDLTVKGVEIAKEKNINIEELQQYYNEKFDRIVEKIYKKSKKLKETDININTVLDWITLNLDDWYNNMVTPLIKEIIEA